MTTTTIPPLNISTVADIGDYVLLVSEGTFFNLLIVVLWFIFFVMSKMFSSERGFVVASFLCALIAFPLALLGYVNFTFVVVFSLMTGLGVVLSI